MNHTAITNQRVRSSTVDLHVIIPAYNVEKYVEQCVDSVLTQSTHYSFHVSIVDDGSTDDTPQIVDKYQGRSNVDVIHQSNRGLSGARNTGMTQMRGRYVMFVDSDDMLPDGAIESLMNKATEGDYDIVGGGYETFEEDKKKRNLYLPTKCQLYGFAWSKIYKSSLWNTLQFPEGYWFEDTICSLIVHRMATKIATVPISVYCYRRNVNSITHLARRAKSVKNLDSLWITLRLLKDRQELCMPFTHEDYETLLEHIKIIARRVLYIDKGSVNFALFTVQKKVLRDYGKQFIGTSDKYRELETALLKDHYKQYLLSCAML